MDFLFLDTTISIAEKSLTVKVMRIRLRLLDEILWSVRCRNLGYII